ncbi:hypothetical protein FRC16_008749, partial [Serendipita sp. 398]
MSTKTKPRWTLDELKSMSRAELQKHAKDNHIKANDKSQVLIEKLSKLEISVESTPQAAKEGTSSSSIRHDTSNSTIVSIRQENSNSTFNTVRHDTSNSTLSSNPSRSNQNPSSSSQGVISPQGTMGPPVATTTTTIKTMTTTHAAPLRSTGSDNKASRRRRAESASGDGTSGETSPTVSRPPGVGGPDTPSRKENIPEVEVVISNSQGDSTGRVVIPSGDAGGRGDHEKEGISGTNSSSFSSLGSTEEVKPENYRKLERAVKSQAKTIKSLEEKIDSLLAQARERTEHDEQMRREMEVMKRAMGYITPDAPPANLAPSETLERDQSKEKLQTDLSTSSSERGKAFEKSQIDLLLGSPTPLQPPGTLTQNTRELMRPPDLSDLSRSVKRKARARSPPRTPKSEPRRRNSTRGISSPTRVSRGPISASVGPSRPRGGTSSAFRIPTGYGRDVIDEMTEPGNEAEEVGSSQETQIVDSSQIVEVSQIVEDSQLAEDSQLEPARKRRRSSDDDSTPKTSMTRERTPTAIPPIAYATTTPPIAHAATTPPPADTVPLTVQATSTPPRPRVASPNVAHSIASTSAAPAILPSAESIEQPQSTIVSKRTSKAVAKSAKSAPMWPRSNPPLTPLRPPPSSSTTLPPQEEDNEKSAEESEAEANSSMAGGSDVFGRTPQSGGMPPMFEDGAIPKLQFYQPGSPSPYPIRKEIVPRLSPASRSLDHGEDDVSETDRPMTLFGTELDSVKKAKY